MPSQYMSASAGYPNAVLGVLGSGNAAGYLMGLTSAPSPSNLPFAKIARYGAFNFVQGFANAFTLSAFPVIVGPRLGMVAYANILRVRTDPGDFTLFIPPYGNSTFPT